LSSFSIKRTWITYQVAITGNDVTCADDRVVLIAVRPCDQDVVIVSPPYGRDIMITNNNRYRI